MPARICVVIPGPTFEDARKQIAHSEKFTDLFEFRLDLFAFSDIATVQKLRQTTPRPVMFTLRRADQGGTYKHSEENRLKDLLALLELRPDYLDLEADTEVQFFNKVQEKFPKTEIVCSWHDFKGTPADLNALYNKMKQKPAHIYKLGVMAQSILDTFRMLKLVKEKSKNGDKIVGICMGEIGEITRVLGPVFGGEFTYACVNAEHATAPGQIDAETLHNTFNYKQLNASTQLYGLLGNPVKYSRSHQTHNAVMKELNLNAVYVKLLMKPEELKTSLAEAKALGFCGFSVTTPLKEHFFPHVKKNSQVVHAVSALNTLQFTAEGIYGDNTDAPALIELIERKMSIEGKHVVLLGAGGVSKATAYMLHQKRARMTILNRTVAKAEELARLYGAEFGDLESFPEIARGGYDILINGTSVGFGTGEGSAIDLSWLLPSKLVVEAISKPVETPLVKEALKRHCDIIYGYEMFIDQAAKQFALWFDGKVAKEARQILRAQF